MTRQRCDENRGPGGRGEGRSGQLITGLIDLYRQGRFPFDRPVRYYELDEIEQALADSASGEVVKPILRMPQ